MEYSKATMISFIKSLATLPQDRVSLCPQFLWLQSPPRCRPPLSSSHRLFSQHSFVHYGLPQSTVTPCTAVSLPAVPLQRHLHAPGGLSGSPQGGQSPPEEERGACCSNNNFFFSPCSKLDAHGASGLTDDTISDAVANCILLMLNEPTGIHFNVVTGKWDEMGVTKL